MECSPLAMAAAQPAGSGTASAAAAAASAAAWRARARAAAASGAAEAVGDFGRRVGRRLPRSSRVAQDTFTYAEASNQSSTVAIRAYLISSGQLFSLRPRVLLTPSLRMSSALPGRCLERRLLASLMHIGRTPGFYASVCRVQLVVLLQDDANTISEDLYQQPLISSQEAG